MTTDISDKLTSDSMNPKFRPDLRFVYSSITTGAGFSGLCYSIHQAAKGNYTAAIVCGLASVYVLGLGVKTALYLPDSDKTNKTSQM